MNRLSAMLVLLVVYGVAGCGFGGGSGGGGGIAPISTAPVGSGSWIPTNVTRSPNYAFNLIYTPNQAAGGAITAIAAAPTTTDVWCGISPLGRVDHVTGQGQVAETSFVFDVANFAVIGSNVYAATANPVAALAGAVYSRDPSSAQWMLSLNGSLNECVSVAFLNTIYAFQGMNDGLPAQVSVLNSSTSTWTNVALLGSMVPAATTTFNSEMWVGGRTNKSAGGPASLFHGNGTTFTSVNVPAQTFMGQIASVMALAVANNTLFVAVEVRDAVSGATVGGNLYYYDPAKGLQNVNQLQGDAPICLAAADGTIYAGTRTGKLLWLDEKGKWNAEATLPANLGVTAVVWDGKELEVGVRSNAGAQLYARIGSGTPTGSGLTFTSITPSSGPVAGGTAVTITGNNFATVTVVDVGGVPLTNLKVVSDIQITGTTGAGSVGAADVVIISPSKGQVKGTGTFTFQGAALSYATDILPALNQNCQIAGCHVTGGSGAAYSLSPYAALMAGKSSGGVSYVTPGNIGGSFLAQKIDPTFPGDPLGGDMKIHLAAGQAQSIETWISQGAKQ